MSKRKTKHVKLVIKEHNEQKTESKQIVEYGIGIRVIESDYWVVLVLSCVSKIRKIELSK